MPSVTGALRRGAMYLAVVGTPAALPGATVTVNDTGDQLHNVGCAATGVGACTLRDAIAFSNQNPGKDTIAAAPGLGAIVPGAPLPALTDTFEIRGTPPGVGGPPFTRGFHLQGFAAGAGAHGLLVQASDSVVDGVLVELFAGSGLRVTGHRNTLGAPYGAYIVAPVVGVGNEVRSNGGPGIEISGGSDNRIYNSSISGNLGPGISLVNGAARNFIGDHYTYEVGQGFTHYYFNWITYNAGAGIQVGASAADTQTTGNVARFNVFQGNVGLPIDLAGDGSTANDPVDADTGPNGLQNAPNISVTWDGTKHRIDGTLQTTPNTAFEAHAHGGDASNVRIPVGRAVGTTDGTGNATFTIDVRPDDACRALAVAVSTNSGSSELSLAVVASSPTPPPPIAPVFHTLPPCRLVDTRDPVSPWGGPILSSGTPRSFDLNEACGVPASAKVVSVNVTVTQPSGPGFLSFGVGTCPVTATSTINFSAGQTRANSAFLILANDGKATVMPSEAVHLILDVNGYFE